MHADYYLVPSDARRVLSYDTALPLGYASNDLADASDAAGDGEAVLAYRNPCGLWFPVAASERTSVERRHEVVTVYVEAA